MSRLLLVALLLTTGCLTRVPRERESEVFFGVGPSVLPDFGATAVAGQRFRDTHDRYDLAFELRGTFQGGDDSRVESGRFFQVALGLKQTFSPGHASHLVLRGGATWLRANGDPDFLDASGDYAGLYLGAGYEWELSPRWTLAPGVDLFFVEGEGGLGAEIFPQLTLLLIFNF